jgi:serine/threonine protein kinase
MRRLGPYFLGDTIGEGTFGKVKTGTHALTDEKVAIKILEKNKIVDEKDVRRVRREIEILKRNRHVNVVQLYDVVDTPSKVYLVMVRT